MVNLGFTEQEKAMFNGWQHCFTNENDGINMEVNEWVLSVVACSYWTRPPACGHFGQRILRLYVAGECDAGTEGAASD